MITDTTEVDVPADTGVGQVAVADDDRLVIAEEAEVVDIAGHHKDGHANPILLMKKSPDAGISRTCRACC